MLCYLINFNSLNHLLRENQWVIHRYIKTENIRMIQKMEVNYPRLILGSLNTQGGFYSKLKLNEFNQLVRRCDIFCLQETYLENDQKVSIPGYELLRSEQTKQKKARRNCGGVMVMYKSSLATGVTPVSSENKHFIWLKLNSIHFGLDEDIFACGLCLPPSNSITGTKILIFLIN